MDDSASDTSDENEVDYEERRKEKIKRNIDKMKTLGILSGEDLGNGKEDQDMQGIESKHIKTPMLFLSDEQQTMLKQLAFEVQILVLHYLDLTDGRYDREKALDTKSLEVW